MYELKKKKKTKKTSRSFFRTLVRGILHEFVCTSYSAQNQLITREQNHTYTHTHTHTHTSYLPSVRLFFLLLSIPTLSAGVLFLIIHRGRVLYAATFSAHIPYVLLSLLLLFFFSFFPLNKCAYIRWYARACASPLLVVNINGAI